jgi:hypothetical protein
MTPPPTSAPAPRHRLTAAVLALAALLLSATAHATVTVLTSDGRLLEGTLRSESDSVLVLTQRTGPAVRIDPARILLLRNSALSTSLPARGVVLTSGTAFPVAAFGTLESAARTARKLTLTLPSGRNLEIPLSALSMLTFSAPTSGAAHPFPPGDVPGLLLRSGDFYDGELLALTQERIDIASTLFGDRDFSPTTEAAALRLRPAAQPRAAVLVRLADGTTARSAAFSHRAAAFHFDDPVLGQLSSPLANLALLDATDGKLTPLTSGNPRPPLLRGNTPWPASSPPILIPPGGEATLALPPKANALFARLGVPAHILPTSAVRVSILLDNVRVYRSPPLNSLDDPITLSLSVAGKQTLTLRTEPEAADQSPPPACLADAVLTQQP